MRGWKRVLMFAAVVTLMSRALFAQSGASISGVVKDASGAVLPGVTVEASSPALIEKSRSAITDGTGQYKITELLPGTYTVTFTLTGFSNVKREGIALIGSFAMALRYSFDMGREADMVEKAITGALDKGLRTADIKSPGTTVLSTAQMGDAILAELEAMS